MVFFFFFLKKKNTKKKNPTAKQSEAEALPLPGEPLRHSHGPRSRRGALGDAGRRKPGQRAPLLRRWWEQAVFLEHDLIQTSLPGQTWSVRFFLLFPFFPPVSPSLFFKPGSPQL